MRKTITYLTFFIGITVYSQTIETNYSYDSLNRLVQAVYEDGITKTYVYDDLGNRIQIDIDVEVLGVDEEVLKNTITIYPNPASDFLKIQFPENITSTNSKVALYDINGRMVTNYQFKFHEKEIRIPVNDLSNGVYLIQIISESQKWSQLFIKK